MKKLETKDLILIIIAVIMTLFNIVLYYNIVIKEKINNSSNYIGTNGTNASIKTEEEQLLEKLQQMTERDRMEYYFSEFISYIQSKEYTKAYELLYPEFRDKYFKTQEEFKNYVKKLYPESVGFLYNDIQRQGDIYVLLITVIDTNKNVGQEKEQRIVIKENNFNDFAISFQVI